MKGIFKSIQYIAISAFISVPALCVAGVHPSLLFTKEEVKEMKENIATAPLFEKSIQRVITSAENSLSTPIEVPVPCDGGGGPAHEKHKSNYYEMMDCGVAYQFTGDERYAKRVADMLDAYSDLYSTLDYHPMTLSPVRGKLFWQTLNESVFLVHTAVAYDCVKDYLAAEQRNKIEQNLLVPMSVFIMEGTDDNRANLKTFNKMHNHGTWATAAIGMTGLAMDNNDLVDKALYGTDKTGKQGGFIQQMDELFSPDGYFTEGAYYQRYALWPFVIFAQCINNSRPELKVFEKRDNILSKAFDTLFQLSYEGEFMHINDAMEKGLSAQEIVYAADILYGVDPENEMLPYIARNYHNETIPCMGGFRLAQAVEAGKGTEPPFRSIVLHDGKDGSQGGIGVFRDNSNGRNTAVTMKATSHGLSHGHYDKLTMAYYDNGKEILPDYGASRFINLEAKNSGHYTRENDSFCKQSVAHNTLVADKTSHFDGVYKTSSKHHSDFVRHYVSEDGKIKGMTAKESNAYGSQGIEFTRTLISAELPGLEFPVVLDVVHASSDSEHSYDLPYWYRGHLVSTNTSQQRSLSSMSALGEENGYQHIWQDALCTPQEKAPLQFTFFNGDRMYTITTATSDPAYGTLMHLGANDPDFNLREEKGWMLSVPQATTCTFASVIEPHGHYDVVRETAEGTVTNVKNLEILSAHKDGFEVALTYGDNNQRALLSLAPDGSYTVNLNK